MTSSIKWEPIEDFKAIRDLVDHTLARTYGRFPRFLGGYPPVDVAEIDEAFVVAVDMPGVPVDEVNVVVSGDSLTIKAKRQWPGVVTGDKAQKTVSVLRERPMGKFSRSVNIPKGVDVEQISAEMQDGVLTLTMPKKSATQVVQIEVGSAEE